MFEIVETHYTDKANIKVIGVGGGGGNAVEHMIANTIEGVDFVCANTDAQALAKSSASVHLQLGANLTKGLGAGADPELGRAAALEDRDRIAEILDGTDMLFVTAGMGGGTGTGASPVIAEVARDLDVLTVAVVTRPFPFELGRRMTIAAAGIDELSKQVDSLIVVPNERLISVLGRGVTLKAAFAAANDVLLGAVQGISELIIRPGLVNVDFADVRAVMCEKGRAMMGAGRATGQDRAFEAAKKATTCPLLENVDLHGARGILVNITADPNLGMDEYAAVGEVIESFAAPGPTSLPGPSSTRTRVRSFESSWWRPGWVSVERPRSRTRRTWPFYPSRDCPGARAGRASVPAGPGDRGGRQDRTAQLLRHPRVHPPPHT